MARKKITDLLGSELADLQSPKVTVDQGHVEEVDPSSPIQLRNEQENLQSLQLTEPQTIKETELQSLESPDELEPKEPKTEEVAEHNSKAGDLQSLKVTNNQSLVQPESEDVGVPKYLQLERKEVRLRLDQLDALTTLTRRLNRARKGKGERLTENTLIRVAIDLLLARLRRNLRRGDPKVRRLQSLLADGKPTLVFSGLRATVDHLRRHLTPTGRIAWCTGRSAGIGRTRVRRSAVLAWFRPSAPGPLALAPSVLVTTDVAAEGMDLHGAVRVVHYDLPWTPSRLDQRAGRVRRIGSSHAEVEVVRFLPPPLLAVRLRVLDALARKAGLPGRLGVGEQPDENWTWRARMAAVARDAVAPGCIASARASAPGMLLAFRAGPGGDGPTQVWLRDAGGRWRADPGSIEAALAAALASPALPEPTPAERARALRQASTLIARRLREVAGAVWGLRAPSPLARAAIARIRTLAARCVRRRDTAGLARADAALAFLRRGHTVGEGMLVERLALCAEDELPGALGMLPPAPPIPRPVRATLLGMILFRRG